MFSSEKDMLLKLCPIISNGNNIVNCFGSNCTAFAYVKTYNWKLGSRIEEIKYYCNYIKNKDCENI
jgi:hypothetical protein